MAIARLIAQADAIVQESGNSEGFDAARWVAAWLDEPHPALGRRRPSELMDTEAGRALVASGNYDVGITNHPRASRGAQRLVSTCSLLAARAVRAKQHNPAKNGRTIDRLADGITRLTSWMPCRSHGCSHTIGLSSLAQAACVAETMDRDGVDVDGRRNGLPDSARGGPGEAQPLSR